MSSASYNPAIGSTLVASGYGDDTGGGVFSFTGRGQSQIDRLSTTGLAVSPDGRVLVRVLRNDDEAGSPGELLLYDHRGVHTYRRIDQLQDGHAAIWHHDHIVVASTLTNSILWIDEAGSVVREWQAPGEGDCWHLNGLALHDGRLVASAFGRFEAHRGWAQPSERDGAGFVFDVESGREVLSGLTTPHDPLALDGEWLVCNSALGELVRFHPRGEIAERASLGAWTRGLTYDDEHIYVGLSANRYAGGGDDETASVAVLDRRDLRVLERLPMPCREVFALAFIPDSLVRGLETGFRTNRLRAAEQDVNRLLRVGGGDGAARQPPSSPLPEDQCRVALEVDFSESRMEPEQLALAPFRLVNLASVPLPSVPPHPVHVGVRWFDARSGELIDERMRTRLLKPVEPGGSMAGVVRLLAPSEPGTYRIAVSAVQENVRWFDTDDAASAWWGFVEVGRRGRIRRLRPGRWLSSAR